MLVRRIGVKVRSAGVRQQTIYVTICGKGRHLKERQDNQQRNGFANH